MKPILIISAILVTLGVIGSFSPPGTAVSSNAPTRGVMLDRMIAVGVAEGCGIRPERWGLAISALIRRESYARARRRWGGTAQGLSPSGQAAYQRMTHAMVHGFVVGLASTRVSPAICTSLTAGTVLAVLDRMIGWENS